MEIEFGEINEISFADIKEIANTLPIGYYAKRKIAIGFDNEAETSKYNPLEDKITFAYQNIVDALSSANGIDEEVAIRSVLYHEVSHAVLTPLMPMERYLNIFEDERIETLLKGYYMNTDFNALLNAISPYNDSEPITSPEQAFFVLCRYRVGRKPLVRAVEKIIKNYAFMSSKNTYDDYITRCYRYDVKRLWEKICEDFGKNPSDYASQNFEKDKCCKDFDEKEIEKIQSFRNEGATVEDKENIDASKNTKGEEKVSGNVNGEKANLPQNGENGENGEDSENSEHQDNKNAKDGEEEDIKNVGKGGLGDRIFANAFGGFIDNSLTERLMNIISIFNKKNSSGNGTTGHSGILNPRYCGNEDYRFFERKLEARGNNRFGSLHLNLFIDTSGSFFYNKETVNKLIIALTAVERKNKNFSLDIVHCGVGEILQDKNHRLINPNGGNRVDENFGKIFRSLQKGNTYNYNIILFDGDCEPDNDMVFCSADTCNTTIIAERSNKYVFDRMKTAKVIYTTKYAQELYENVFVALQRAFR